MLVLVHEPPGLKTTIRHECHTNYLKRHARQNLITNIRACCSLDVTETSVYGQMRQKIKFSPLEEVWNHFFSIKFLGNDCPLY